MNKTFSIYLDIIRFLAACLVFLSHIPSFMGGYLWQLSGLGHESVVVFFVLSGFVISYVVYEKKETAKEYTLNRLTRIYSVVLPALLVTGLLYGVGHAIDPSVYNIAERKMADASWIEITTRALSFTNQSWNGVAVFSNLPYWSLGYEVWYYIFFGCAVFLSGVKRAFFVAICFAVMGPSILLYLPIWLAGVWVYTLRNVVSWSKLTSAVVAVSSMLVFGFLSLEKITSRIVEITIDAIPQELAKWILEPAGYFAVDYLLTIAVIGHILAMYRLSILYPHFEIPLVVSKKIQWLSSHTFSLYLFHMPFLFFIATVFPAKNYLLVNVFCCLVVTPLTILLLSHFIENNRHLLKNFFKNTLKYIKV